MPLSAGTKLGSYEVIAQIGAGGMGEVYRARDKRLNRDVALKVIPQGFASDADRMARFEREAKLLASLNHPNIASIYGLEESSSTNALVMELVEGPTLADRIAAGPIPIDEALPIARQIAEALEYAHDHNVIHRDLKPANIKVKPDGTFKVLDFGFEKAMLDDPIAMDINADKTFHAGVPRKLLESPGVLNGFDITRDSKRFLFVVAAQSAGAPAPFTVLLNWTAGLKN